MGGVTDGPTVIKHLKSVFPQHSKIHKGKLSTDTFIFRIATRFTPTLLLILAGLIFWQRMSNEHINCYAPSEEEGNLRAAAINQYCFVTGTYTVKEYPSHLKSLEIKIPYPGVGPHVPPSDNGSEGTEIKHHLYFQWVPFILLIQAVLLNLPRYVWNAMLRDSLSRYCGGISETQEANKTVAKRFHRNLKKHRSASSGFILCEILIVLLALMCIVVNDKLLSGDFFSFGYNWIGFLTTSKQEAATRSSPALNSTSPLDLVFPKMAKCEFKMFGPGGGIVNYDILCVMTLNVLHDKVFLFLWFWLWAMITLQLLCLIYRLVLRWSKDIQWRLILARVEPAFLGENEDDDLDNAGTIVGAPNNDFYDFKKDARRFVASIGYSDWFMLEAIAYNTDAVKFTSFLQNLTALDNSKKGFPPQTRRNSEVYYDGQKRLPTDRMGIYGWRNNGINLKDDYKHSDVNKKLIEEDSNMPLGQHPPSRIHRENLPRQENNYSKLPVASLSQQNLQRMGEQNLHRVGEEQGHISAQNSLHRRPQNASNINLPGHGPEALTVQYQNIHGGNDVASVGPTPSEYLSTNE